MRSLPPIENRCLPGQGERLMLGPTGARLWMDYMDPAPGFAGRADFIHKMNLPLLFSVRAAGREDGRLFPLRAQWRMEESRFFHEEEGFAFSERKTITWADQALSLQTWENRSQETLALEMALPEGMEWGRPFAFPCEIHGMTPVMAVKSDADWTGGKLVLAPGEKRVFLIAAAVGLPGEEAAMEAGLSELLSRADGERLMDEKAAEYLSWFDDAPEFECDDPFLTECWRYRFYILRKNLSRPARGNLPGECFYEGRSHRMDKTPYGAKGWEFSRLIPLSTPLQVSDARWMKGGKAARAALRSLSRCLDEKGVFAVTSVDECAKEYANFASWALYLYYLVHGDGDFVREALPAFKRDARNVYEGTRAGDCLQVEKTHALTGKEYQPSFWFFANPPYPRNVRPAGEGYTPLKRVDRSVYSYLNFLGLSRLCRALGDGDEEYFSRGAEGMKADILNKMWDPETKCFYDLHHLTDEKALVKNIVAFYPLWAGVTGEEHMAALDYLLDENYFATGSGFASVAADCPVYSSNGGWRGEYIKGPNGCMWNGPSWPYATGIVLDALARQSKERGHGLDGAFEKHLREYTMQHFPSGRAEEPCLVEFYDSRTGRPLSLEADYCHSLYIDLIVRHVAGVEVGEDGVRFHPLKTGLAFFALTGLRARGHDIDVYYQREAGARYPAFGAGYTARVDGKILALGTGVGEIRLTGRG